MTLRYCAEPTECLLKSHYFNTRIDLRLLTSSERLPELYLALQGSYGGEIGVVGKLAVRAFQRNQPRF